jgi:predicted dinucleotide-binding enzyme
MTKKHMIFIVIPSGKFPKTRKQLAKDSGNKQVMNMSLPVFYADEDSRLVYTDIKTAELIAARQGKFARFVEAGK